MGEHGRAPPARSETIHESERTRITRLTHVGRSVVRKEPLGPDAQRRLRRELTFLERLRGVDGMARLMEAPRYPGSIMLEDAGRMSLAGMAKPLPIDDLIGLALDLARAVAGMHRRGVTHRDITPANIMISPSGEPSLIDFTLASMFAEIRPEFTHHTEIVGTLEYLAPEQTGRTGRPVDQRADLYALGATLYELATGGPPFGTGDPLRLTHDHLARVPQPPAEVNRAVPAPLSAIIMHLLQKEPDNRYQTAEGLAYDLERLRGAGPSQTAALRVGEHDLPLRLLPPSRLVGRDAELAALEAAFEETLSARCRGVLVGGLPGVGKTALVDELRPVVTGREGWFVAGKFDQYRRDLEFDAVHQAFRALGRLLLAEPAEELAEVRGRILRALGPNAGLLAAVVPEFATLLGIPPDPGDPLTAQTRSQRVAVDLVRAVASRAQPLVVFLDDLQWAGRTPLGFVDLMLSEEPVEGLLLLGAYRQDEVESVSPLAAPLARWRDQPGVRHLRLSNLSMPSTITLVAEMLHANPATTTGLARVISPYTSGNPHETVELLNVLRRNGVLAATATGWRWDEAAVRARLDRSGVVELQAARAEAMPARSQRVVEAMACLGGRAELSVVQIATATSAEAVEGALAPAIDDGVLVAEPGARQAMRFRHDRIREAVLDGMSQRRRCALQLAMARRLAEVPELFAVAAEQYLPVVGAVESPAERHRTVELLRRAAEQAVLTGEYALVNTLLTAALHLVDPGETAMLIEVRTGRHAALYGLGALDEADEEYRTIEKLSSTALERGAATCVQVRSLTYRTHLTEAIALGVRLLRELGIAVPTADRLPGQVDHQFGYLYRWLDRTDDSDELAWPDITEPTLLTATRVINTLVPASYFAADQAMHAWLSLEALRIWLEHGSTRSLIGPAIHAAFTAVDVRGDYAVAYRAARRILALSEARGYEPDTSQARFLFAFMSCWFEPIENGVQAARRAREGLIAGGDLANAGYTYEPSVQHLLDCAPSLDGCVAEVEAGLAFFRSTGNEQTAQWLGTYRWLAGLLRGEDSHAADEVVPENYMGNLPALFNAHINHAIAAAIIGEPADLVRHTASTMPLPGLYPSALDRLLRGLALAGQARDSQGSERGGLLSELEDVTRWLAARAADAPTNFLHLLRLVEAEHAWAVGDFRAAALAFDAAQREVAPLQRPWHRALIIERAARFYLAHGLDHTGYTLLAEARRQYLAWGATAKVGQLDWAYPNLRPLDDASRPTLVTTGTLDLLGILSTSQALSSETGIERLHARVVQVLGAMTGSTAVHMPLWSDDRQCWFLPGPGGNGPVPLSGDTGEIPMSVLRYAQRTGEPLVMADATGDDRFARDPYFSGLTRCSLLALPILGRDTVRAVLLLENRLMRGAFTTERLDAVKLIAGQLAVSLDNAHIYAEFRRIADEQAALRRVATLVARGVRPESVFAVVAEEVAALIGTDDTAIVRFEPDGEATLMGCSAATSQSHGALRGKLSPSSTMAAVQATGRAARRDVDGPETAIPLESTPAEPDFAVAGPIVVEGRVWGAIGVGSLRVRLPQDTEQRLADFTELVATAIANAESRNELTLSRARIVTASDQARRLIERDLHDSVQQRLIALALRLRAAQAAVPPELGDFAADLDELVAEATGAQEELREIAHGIHPASLAKIGIGAAVRALARRSPLPVNLDVRVAGGLPQRVEISAYYVVAEALANAAKHAHASAIAVTVETGTADAVLQISVRDDGVGGADFARGTGLTGLKDRVEALGGRVLLDSPRAAGTHLYAELPLTTTNGDS
ncbi:AAA family ATPase [Spirillospora sp. CA-108201]